MLDYHYLHYQAKKARGISFERTRKPLPDSLRRLRIYFFPRFGGILKPARETLKKRIRRIVTPPAPLASIIIDVEGSFFNKRWFFDQVLNDFLVRSFLRFGYEVSFEALDKGAIEILGRYGISYTFRRLAERISQLQSGFVVRRGSPDSRHYGLLSLPNYMEVV
ncbi:hypothetical protein RYX36_028947 [Vicia faba]